MTAAPPFTIVPARERDLPALATIERAAGALLADLLPPAQLDDSELADLRAARRDGRLWVALVDDAPVGFALVELLADGLPHLEEVDVHPAHGRRGIGTALVRTVCAWAARAGHPELTLTTFRVVPWNRPFYARLGFEDVAPEAVSPAVADVVRDETARGLDPRLRVVMRWRP